MNQRNQVVIEIVKNERTFAFCIPFGANYDEVVEVATIFLTQSTILKDTAEKAEAEKAKREV